MNRLAMVGACSAAAIAVITGCSSPDSETAETTSAAPTSESATATLSAGVPTATPGQPDAGRVKFGNTEVAPVTEVGCQTDAGVTTITIEAPQKTTVVLTDEDAPTVQSVSIGDPGSDGPSLVFLEGVSPAPQASREGKKFTVSGSGMGTDAADPANPVEMPFEIAVSCP